MARKVENTLYVTKDEAYVKKQQEILIVEIDEEEVIRVPGLHLGNIILFNQASISHHALNWCAKNDVTVSRLDRNGRFIGRWVGPVSGNVLLRLEQFKLINENPKYACELGKNFVKGKLLNSRAMLLRSARDIKSEESERRLRKAVKDIDNLMNDLENCNKIDEVRGFEGRAAKVYFSCINNMIKTGNKDFKFTGRKKRPPRDNVNALFSYLYVILCHDCNSALESIGLDPQMGYLHALRPGKPALALDLMEELRPIMVERVVVTLINRKQVKSGDFEKKSGGAVEMKEDCRKLLIQTYQDKKHEEIYHPFFDKKVPYGLIPYLQARLLARTIRGDIKEYPPFLYQ